MTISAVATVPSTALLIPEVAAGAAPELEVLRRIALQRIHDTVEVSDRLMVIAGSRSVDSVGLMKTPSLASLRPIGLDRVVFLQPWSSQQAEVHEREEIPLAVSVAGWLLSQVDGDIPRQFVVVPSQTSVNGAVVSDVFGEIADSAGGRLGVIVVGDGAATRTPKSPGAFVDGAIAWDDQWLAAWHKVDCDWFTDPARSDEAQMFLVDGVGAWSFAAALIAGTAHQWMGCVDHHEDPYGVMYSVGGWNPRL
jgi:hypothetical protein